MMMFFKKLLSNIPFYTIWAFAVFFLLKSLSSAKTASDYLYGSSLIGGVVAGFGVMSILFGVFREKEIGTPTEKEKKTLRGMRKIGWNLLALAAIVFLSYFVLGVTKP